ncbi:MAG: PEGA domain-containing protein [Rikenellaceae bacterium]|nr:PEGA domain-containing protein [Rikenellaceae bacterium]
MKRFLFAILTLIAFTATAQMENSIVLDAKSFRAVQQDELTGVNIDPIGLDHSRQACARIKIKFDRMSKAQIDALEVKMRSNTDLTKQKVADYYDNVLILEMTAKPNTRFYFYSPEFGESNEVTLNLEGNSEYEMLASLNQTFSIVVSSNAENVDIYLDDVFKGKTDSSKSLTIKEVLIGAHTLKAVYGTVSSQQTIEVNSGSILFRQNVDTAASRPQFVVFAVEPQSAVVTIDGKHYSLTDGAMRLVLESGTYNYTVSAAGYHSQSGTFTVAGSKVTKQIALTADAATVTLTVADNAEIWVNGEKVGNSRWSGTLNSGTYIFEAKKAGHSTTTTSKHITSDNPQQSYTLESPKPLFGSLIVDGSPLMADVAIDGVGVGQMPLSLDNLLVGQHKITVSKSGYQPYTTTITVAEGKAASVNITLTKQLTSEQLRIKGDECYDKKDYASAVEYYRKAAEQGNAAAQNRLGICYNIGLGVGKDSNEAIKWYRKAAEQGNAVAQNNMGNYYNERQNYTEAARWYRKAAEQGQIAAQDSLAELYYNGRGVAKDYAEAVKWFRKAAEQGAVGSQYQLGNCYYFGYGVTQSYAEAVKWYRKAAEIGLADAQSDLGYCYRMGQGVVRDDAEGVKWYRKAAEQGCVQAQINLADCYRAGNGVTKSIPEAVKWYRKAASRGSDEAKSKLAELGY